MDKLTLLKQITNLLKTTDDIEKHQWLLGAQAALLALDCNRETLQENMWDNQISMIAGVK